MRYISTQTDNAIRFVGLSTALANAEDIADWLGIGTVGLFNFPSEVRPVPCITHIDGFSEKHYCPRMVANDLITATYSICLCFQATMNKPCYQRIKELSPDRPVLIFVSSRRQTRITALDLVGLCGSDDERNFFRFRWMSDEEYNYHRARVRDESLQKALEHGIGIHHAGLSEKDRKVVEELFTDKKIQILVTTATLAWGVNFPAHLVIIKGTEYYDGKLKRYVDMPITDILQMIGRAGRPQFDTSGQACIFVHQPKKSFYKKFLHEPFPVESSLADHLTDHLNAEIAAGTVTSKASALEYLRWTYFFRRLWANSAYYDPQASIEMEKHRNDPRALRQHVFDYLERIVEGCLSNLTNAGCVSFAEDGTELRIEATRLGRTASLHYLKHETVSLFQRSMRRKERLGWADVLKLLCDCAEYSELPVRHNEDKLNFDLAELCPLDADLSAADSPHLKAFLLVQAHVFNFCELLPISDYNTDLADLLDQSLRIMQGMSDVAAEEGHLTSSLNIILALQCLMQATTPARSSLYTFPHLRQEHIRQLDAGGISLAKMVEMEQKQQREALQTLRPGLTSEQVTDACKVTHSKCMSSLVARHTVESFQGIGQLPRLRVHVELFCEGQLSRPPYHVSPDSSLEIKVRLEYANRPTKMALTALSKQSKTHSWMVLLGDEEVDELIGLKRVSLRGKTSSAVFKFSAPEADEGASQTQFQLTIYVLSDTYVGLDQTVPLSIHVC